MGTEAQKLITVSLEKIANCRRRRREMSLHKNLLVTTVIHKARIAIMEETYYMMSYATTPTNTMCNTLKVADSARTTTTGVLPVYCHTNANGAPSAHYVNVGQEPMYYDDRTGGYGNSMPQTPPVSISTTDYSYQQPQQLPVFSASVAVADFGGRENSQEAMEWEGMDAPVVDPAGMRTGATTVVGGSEDDEDADEEGEEDDEGGTDSDVDDDKENVSPLDYTASSPAALRAHRLSTRLSRCKKRGRMTTNDDESTDRKRMRWDPLYVPVAEATMLDDSCGGGGGGGGVVLSSRVMSEDSSTLPGFDPHDEMSTALRFVSVLSASLGGGGSSSSSVSLQQAVTPPHSPLPPSSCQAMRLGRSLSTPELCSKQAKDSLEMIGSRTPVLAIAV